MYVRAFFGLSCLSVLSGNYAYAQEQDWAACSKKRGDVAIAACTNLIERGDQSDKRLAEAHYNRGYEYDALREFDKAMADYREAIRLDPEAKLAHNNLGLMLYEKGGRAPNREAHAAYSRAIEIDPELSQAYFNRGVVRFKLGDYSGAVADFEKTLSLKPDHKLAPDWLNEARLAAQ